MKKSFLLYTDFYPAIEAMEQKDKSDLLDAIFQYNIEGTTKSLSPLCQMAFNFIRSALDRDNKKWEDEIKARSDAGKKGMAKRWGKITKHNGVISDITKITNITNITDSVSVSVKVKEEIQSLYNSYKELVNKEARLTDKAVVKIKTRLKTFSLEDLISSLKKFSSNDWQMEHNAGRGIAWFFDSDDRIDSFLATKTVLKQQTAPGLHFNSLPITQ